MDPSDSRRDTAACVLGAATSTALFWAVFGPALAFGPANRGVTPGMHPLAMLAVPLGYSWWVACAAVGCRQLFARPRRYGLFTLAAGALQFLAVPGAVGLLMRARGLHWGTG